MNDAELMTLAFVIVLAFILVCAVVGLLVSYWWIGRHRHDWGKWTREREGGYTGLSPYFQWRYCRTCGKKQEKHL